MEAVGTLLTTRQAEQCINAMLGSNVSQKSSGQDTRVDIHKFASFLAPIDVDVNMDIAHFDSKPDIAQNLLTAYDRGANASATAAFQWCVLHLVRLAASRKIRASDGQFDLREALEGRADVEEEGDSALSISAFRQFIAVDLDLELSTDQGSALLQFIDPDSRLAISVELILRALFKISRLHYFERAERNALASTLHSRGGSSYAHAYESLGEFSARMNAVRWYDSGDDELPFSITAKGKYDDPVWHVSEVDPRQSPAPVSPPNDGMEPVWRYDIDNSVYDETDSDVSASESTEIGDVVQNGCKRRKRIHIKAMRVDERPDVHRRGRSGHRFNIFCRSRTAYKLSLRLAPWHKTPIHETCAEVEEEPGRVTCSWDEANVELIVPRMQLPVNDMLNRS